jgi:hypothetical protein
MATSTDIKWLESLRRGSSLKRPEKWFVLIMLAVVAFPAAAQNEQPIPTTTCELSSKPEQFDGKMIRVRGYITSGDEDFTIHNRPGRSPDDCAHGIWLSCGGDGKGPSKYAVIDPLRPGDTQAQWREHARRDSVRFVRDQQTQEMSDKLQARRRYRLDGSPCLTSGLCRLYNVSATITGRFYAKDVHSEAHDHFLIIQQITEVQAERTTVPEESQEFVCSTQTWKLTPEEAEALAKFESTDACSPGWVCRWRQYFTKVAEHWNDHIEVEKGVIPFGFALWISPDLTLEYAVEESASREKKSKKMEAAAVERKECKPVPAQPE